MRCMTLFVSLILACFLFSACDREKTSETKQHLRLNFFSEPAGLDPRKANYTLASNVYSMLFDGLMRLSPSGKLLPSVAKSVTVSNDGRFYIFHLRQSRWSNGDPVTAYDFEYAWKWILDPENPAPMASHLYCLKNGKMAKEGSVPASWVGVFARDSDTLIVELEYPLPYFLELVSDPIFYPVNHLNPDSEPLGNGPFVLKEWCPQREMSLEKSPTYWDAEDVALEEIDISFIQDPNTELNLYKKGQLDWAGPPLSGGLPYNSLPRLRSENLLHTRPLLGTYYYSFNTERPPLNNLKIRRALSLALRRQEIVDHITQGGELPAYHFVPAELNAENNPEKGTSIQDIQMLFEEGLKELNLTRSTLPSITLSYNKSDLHHALAQAAQHCWKELLNLEVKLKHQDWKAHLSEIQAGNFDIARLSWKGMSNDPIHFLEIFQDPKHPMHHSLWENRQYKKLIQRAMRSNQVNERLFYLTEAEKILNREVPVAPLFHLTICYVKKPELKDYVISPLGGIDFKWAKLAADDDQTSY